ncbi:hypothetical protein M9H77_34786 [Catharanthus roseus]|uniref:Uncharacterized protein n=1 Tax=Catharanthus roseus TaxID=4058 RepID=A0ACB9ZND4_CATRO|nr:hypothetical protein M9H77_34786 [Catharanthus roseus]
MVLNIERLIVFGLIMGGHAPPIYYVSLGKDKKLHTSVLAYLAGETAKLNTNRVGGRPPTSEVANKTDDTLIAPWAQAPRTQGHRSGTFHGSQDLSQSPPYPVSQASSRLPPEMITAFQAMAQALQKKDKPKITVITFYERMRKSNVPTFGGEADPEKANKWIRDMERNF